MIISMKIMLMGKVMKIIMEKIKKNKLKECLIMKICKKLE